MTDKAADILIVGAGPVGLTAAVELSRRGYSPRIVEQGTGPHVESRALGINPRTLDILEPSGAAERLLAAGIKVRAINFHNRDRQLFRIETARLPHPRHSYILALPQAETEQHLIDTLGGIKKIDWETKVTKLALEDNRPVVTLQHGKNSQTITPDIVIGADGAHSTIRKSLGIGFSGEAYEHDWGLLDAHINGLAQEELHAFDFSPLLIAFIPIRGNLFRVVADTVDVESALPTQLDVEKIVWQSRFRIAHRQVETYQMGPVYLAGDAAHIHSPAGGRGMNLGIEDAAWLAYLIETGETENYTHHRHPVAKTVLREVDTATRFMSSDGAIARVLRHHLLPPFARTAFMQSRALRGLAGLNAPPPPWLAQE